MSAGRRGGAVPPGPEGDRLLLDRHLAGDAEAFGELVARHRDRLWAVAVRTVGDREEAADALQDGLLNAFRRAASYRGDAAVTTWLHRIVVNACLDRLRRRALRLADPLPDEERGLPAEGGRSPGPGEGARRHADPAETSALRLDVAAALATLPPEQRVALVLVDMQGYPVEEAARILDCPTGTVKSRCARGRARLLPLLAPGRRAERNHETGPRVTPSTGTPAGPRPGAFGPAPDQQTRGEPR